MFRAFFDRRWPAATDPVETAFGVLERDVMHVLWHERDLAVKDVQARLARPIAYTTVMTTLDRLFKKGVLSRRRVGRAFLYSAAVTSAELRAKIAGTLLTGLINSHHEGAMPVLSNLVDSVGEQNGGAELLQKLEAMVRDKRKELTKSNGR